MTVRLRGPQSQPGSGELIAMRLTLHDIATATGGRLAALGEDTARSTSVAFVDGDYIDGVQADSRVVEPHQLFAAIRAERDGHEFVRAAFERGAAAALVERTSLDMLAGPSARFVVVEDTMAALVDLARVARARLPRLIAVTGSSGKTTTKDLVSAVLGRRGPHVRSDKSFNNELGVPLTLLNAPDDAWSGIVEMGARGVGHIAHLVSIAQPDVAMVLNVGRAHIGMYEDGQAGIARAKGEIVEQLPVDGTAVLNADDPLVIAMADRTRADILRFSSEGKNVEVRAQTIYLDDQLCARFRLVTPWGESDVRVGVPGRHQVANALAAAAACGAIGSSLDEIVAGLSGAELSPWRMDLRRAPAGFRVLNDSYNANPESMAAALDAIGSLDASRRIAVLGPMAELGAAAAAGHREIAERAVARGIELITVDAPLYGVGQAVKTIDDAVWALRSLELSARDAVLVKGSRVAGLERVADALLADLRTDTDTDTDTDGVRP
jgi:UDP-N-acetylmuramoyl-tripeptide--D-alanyl-D-alanine ligase